MKPADIRVVPMTEAHLDEVTALERVCFPDPWSRSLYLSELENERAAWLTALDGDGRVAGYAGLFVVADEGCVTNIAVRPDRRGQGIAAALLDTFIRFAEGSGLAFLTLEVRASNREAIILYGSRGFRAVGRRRNYYEHPREDALLMTRLCAEPEEDGHGDDAAAPD